MIRTTPKTLSPLIASSELSSATALIQTTNARIVETARQWRPSDARSGSKSRARLDTTRPRTTSAAVRIQPDHASRLGERPLLQGAPFFKLGAPARFAL